MIKRHALNALRGVAAACLLYGITGCTPSVALVGEKRDRIPVEAVAVVSSKPSRAKLLANITIKKNFLFSRKMARDRAVRAMRKKAARIGANTVYPMRSSSKWEHRGAPMHGAGFGAPSATRVLTLIGQAFYVQREDER
jgi:hypothetical protein